MGFNIHILSGRRPSQNLDVRAAVAASFNPKNVISPNSSTRPSVYFFESGLFNGLRPIQIKKSSLAATRVLGCAKTPQIHFLSFPLATRRLA
jgi:hypothetical protein